MKATWRVHINRATSALANSAGQPRRNGNTTKEALLRKTSSSLKVDEIVDDSLVVELEKEGFISRIYSSG
jgi:hypothetical protein